MGPRRRSSAALVASAAIHVLFVATFTTLARLAPTPPPREQRPLVFVKMAPAPIVLSEPIAAPQLDPIDHDEAPAPIELPPPPPPPSPAAEVEPAPEPAKPIPPPPAKPEPLKPAPPPVTIGLFENTAAAARSVEPPRPVEAAGFDAPSPASKSGAQQSVAASLGGFDRQVGTAPRDRRPGVVAAAGFGAARNESVPVKQTAAIRSSGFDDTRAEAPAPVRPQPKADPVDQPVEITFKPTPVYTDEARALKVEGDVVLDVEFAASGHVRVLGVARGLGHGLDEAAMQAAAAIRFKPARAAGRSVDFRTTVHIVFRLA
ncbi:MAG: TonB family protein [Acidobacteria bacterium]|nr:TonB family protein [Acidobacteriota bacterium]